MIIYLDIDGVICQTLGAVLYLYFMDTGHRLIPPDITEWGLGQMTETDDPLKYFDHPDLYSIAQPYPEAPEMVARLRTKARVVFATSVQHGSAGRKWEWLVENDIPCAKSDYVELQDKSLLRGWGLLDDYPENLVMFGGYKFLLDQPYNRDVHAFRRVHSLRHFVTIVEAQ